MASLGILSAGIAHEINNPLNFIHGGIVGLECYLTENSKEHIENIQPLINAIHTGVKRASDIVTSLSHYSRKDDTIFSNCKIHAVIDHCLIMLQNQIKNKIQIERHYAPNDLIVYGNEGKLHQAFLNIIINAEQAIEDKGKIEITTEILKNKNIIKIIDSGSGISKENITKIFDPFFTTKPPGKGNGLGLAITFNIIQEHKGTIVYESEKGKGTKVTIELPITKTETI
jgi:signal transduction histidine kinase